jgi:hypothetical protein
LLEFGSLLSGFLRWLLTSIGVPLKQFNGKHRMNCWKPSKYRGNQHPSLEYTQERFRDYLRDIVPLITGISVRHPTGMKI